MSVEGLLIPIGIAAVAIHHERNRTDLCQGCRQTRITDAQLLRRTLQSIGATDVLLDFQGLVVTGHRNGQLLRFQLVQGAFLGRVDDASEEETDSLIAEVEGAVGRLLQADKLNEMRTRAAQLGLVLVAEEVADDGTVQLVFEETQA